MADVLNKEFFSEQVYNILKNDIISGKIAFNVTLPNRELQKRFGVSSTPIRDAIYKLNQDGLVENITKAGAKVMSFNQKRLLELNEMMMFINLSAVELAISKGNSPLLYKELSSAIDIQTNTDLLDVYLEGDNLFHSAFFKYSNNDYLQKIYTQLQPLWLLLLRVYYDDESQKASGSVIVHTEIANAVKENDILKAKEYIRKHFDTANASIESNFKE